LLVFIALALNLCRPFGLLVGDSSTAIVKK
jgi:hypothetical protein